MLEKLRLVEERYMEMEERAAQPDFYADPKAATKLLKEQKQLEPIIKAYRAYKAAEQAMAEARELMDAGDPELKALCQEEFSAAKQDCERLEHELKILLLPRDPNDDKSVIMEIRGGVGGEESALFAHSLYRMYTMYAQRRGWQVSLLNYNETELGGVKEADFEISGEGAYSRLKFESGVHRVQRVPETESGGRVHTSTATVAVLPEMEEAEVDIRPEDIEMQVYRSSGAGGQHINKTSSAVRLIHKPSGIVVACQEERSQVQNREKCMQMLASKLYEIEQEKISSAVTSERRSQVGTGMRNERIRTYNFPQGRVTDHRIGLTLSSPPTRPRSCKIVRTNDPCPIPQCPPHLVGADDPVRPICTPRPVKKRKRTGGNREVPTIPPSCDSSVAQSYLPAPNHLSAGDAAPRAILMMAGSYRLANTEN